MLYADKGGNLVSPTSFCLLPSSGHTFFVKLWFSLQEVLTKDEDKKNDHMPRAADLFPVSACQPKYCLIQKHRKEASANQFKD